MNLRRLPEQLRFAFEYCVLRRDVPVLLGLVITDNCNLHCRHCRVANTGRPALTLAQSRDKLQRFYDRGFRYLYLEGGEPFVWRDGAYRLDDLVAEARRIGYYETHIFTNGTFPLESTADMLWVGLDGLPEDHTALRGDHFTTVVEHLRASAHPKLALVCTVNTLNRDHLREYLEFVREEHLPVRGVMFYFHTPYYGYDELFVPVAERAVVIEAIIGYKRRGLPVLNSYAALRAVQSGRWKRRFASVWVTDVEGEYLCCRDNRGHLCEECGYAAYAELTELQRLRPSALWGLLQYR